MEGFMDWLREHPMLALGVGAVAVFLVIRSVAQKNQQSSSDGSGAQGDIGSGQVVSAGGYTFVPTGSSDQSSSTTSGDVNPNTQADLEALTGFLQAFQQAPGGVTPPSATPALPPGSNAPAQSQSQTVTINKPPKTTKHTHGTPPEVSGVPIVGRHPNNPSPLPPVRMPPVMHPVQGKNHPIGGPILQPGGPISQPGKFVIDPLHP